MAKKRSLNGKATAGPTAEVSSAKPLWLSAFVLCLQRFVSNHQERFIIREIKRKTKITAQVGLRKKKV